MLKRRPTLTKTLATWSRAVAAPSPADLLPSLITGCMTGIIILNITVSLSVLIFSGELTGFVARGIGLFLLGGAAAIIITGFISSAAGTIAATQSAPTAVLAVVTAAVVQSLPPAATPEHKFMTAVAVVATTSLLTGLTFLLLGHLQLGKLVRFLPYPVVGGFLAATGWLLVTGGISVMADVPVSLRQLTPLFQPGAWHRWLPGLGLGVLMLALLNRSSHVLLLPGMLLGATMLFYAVMWLSGKSLAQMGAERWLLGPFPAGGLWPHVTLGDLSNVYWEDVLHHAGGLASIVLVSVLAMLLSASGIELVIKRDVDLDCELRAAGWGSLGSGLLCGPVCYHHLSTTSLNHRSGNGRRLTGWITALICLMPLVVGAVLVSYLPKVVLGGLLVMLGLGFLWEWLYRAWARFPRGDYLIILLILGVSATVGYLSAVQVGLLAAGARFVVAYSQVNVVRHAVTGAELHSRVTRAPHARQRLVVLGDQLFILQLQGFLFFGTAHSLVERVRSRLSDTAQHPLQFVVLDFSHVTGLDSTAVLSFLKLQQIARDAGFVVVLTGANLTVRRQLDHGWLGDATDAQVRYFPDLDHGMEWCEDQLLAGAGVSDDPGPTWEVQFSALLAAPDRVAGLWRYLERQEVPAGAYLMHWGDDPDYVYFLVAGQVTARLEHGDGTVVRLETMRAGRVVGEIGLYVGMARTAAVVADDASSVYRLSREALARMEQEAPELAIAVHRLLARLLAERTSHLIVVVNSLQRPA